MDKLFDCARDTQQIEAGTHFFCQTHQTAVPVENRSPDPRYCQDCYNFLKRVASCTETGLTGDAMGLGVDKRQRGVESDGLQVSVTKTCIFCGNIFTAQRISARYCSAKCRVAANRKAKQ